jgi:hypothetical protein
VADVVAGVLWDEEDIPQTQTLEVVLVVHHH